MPLVNPSKVRKIPSLSIQVIPRIPKMASILRRRRDGWAFVGNVERALSAAAGSRLQPISGLEKCRRLERRLGVVDQRSTRTLSLTTEDKPIMSELPRYAAMRMRKTWSKQLGSQRNASRSAPQEFGRNCSLRRGTPESWRAIPGET